MPFYLIIIQLALVPALSPLFVGIIRKIKAKFQNRAGASIFQPYRDLRKLFNKDEVISADSSWIFRSAPYLIFSASLVLAANIPILTVTAPGGLVGDLLTVIYLIALGTFCLALAGLDTGGAFGGFGSSREMTFASLAEGGLMFSLLVPAILSHSSNLFTIAGNISILSFFSFAPIIIAFAAFIISMLAETARFPFDNPATHLELTMIHEAMILEYSGKRLALVEWAAANKLFIFLALGVNLFFPWGIPPSVSLAVVGFSLVLFFVKALALCLAVAILESITAKFRFFRLADLLFTSFILSVIALCLVI